MDLVIKISEELYRDIQERSTEIQAEGYVLENAVLNGKLLPKGHGRLIDADYLREDFKASKKISFADRMDISCIVDHAPTIIEAEKEKRSKGVKDKYWIVEDYKSYYNKIWDDYIWRYELRCPRCGEIVDATSHTLWDVSVHICPGCRAWLKIKEGQK